MPQRLLIRLSADPDRAAWTVRDAAGAVLQSGIGLASLPGEGRYPQVDVLVPGSDVVCTQVSVPTTQRSQLLQAVPFALEDQLATDLDRMHVAVGAQHADGWVEVAAVERATMDRWLELLAEAGVDALRLLPEPLLLPPNSVVIETDRATFRLPDLAGAAEPELLEAIVAKAGLTPEDLAVRKLADADSQAFLGELASELDSHAPINLLQGAYARHSAIRAWWQQWRWAAAFACAAVLGLFANEAANVWQLNKASDQIAAQSQEALNAVFPDAPVTDNPRLQMRQSIAALRASKGLGSDGGFLALLREVGPGISQDTTVQLDEVQFRNDQLEIQLTFASVEALDRFRNRLESNAGLAVEVLSATTGAEGVMGRLRIVSAGRAT